MDKVVFVIGLFTFLQYSQADLKNRKDEFVAVTVSSKMTKGFRRLQESASINSVPLKVLGASQEWRAFGQDMRLLRKELEIHKGHTNRIIMFANSADVLFNAAVDRIVDRFNKLEAKIIFMADDSCWPDKSLASKYPAVKQGKRYLNGALFMGYAPELLRMINSKVIDPQDDEQTFFTRVYLDGRLRKELGICLDSTAELFQNLDKDSGDIDIYFEGRDPHVKNKIYNTVPFIIHANKDDNQVVEFVSRYLLRNWNPVDGCLACLQDTRNIKKIKLRNYPVVLMGIFIEKATPFLEEFFDLIYQLDYPKEKIHLLIHSGVKYHSSRVEDFLAKYGKQYSNVKVIRDSESVNERTAKSMAINDCLQMACEFYFSVDSTAHLDHPETLRLLIEQNRPVLAPMIIQPNTTNANFWSAVTPDGQLARSMDYTDLVRNSRRGLWNVPHVTSCYLVRGDVILNPKTRPSYLSALPQDADVAFCANLRRQDVDMFVTNRYELGHLVANDKFNTSHLHNELYEISNNRFDWEKRYLHANYTLNLDASTKVLMPCQDVYWFPITTERFCDEMVAELEHYGKWSSGANQDSRIKGGYENVPTRDIHLKQIDWQQSFHIFLTAYVQPVQQRVFKGYKQQASADYTFVVRYRPDEQPALRPHFDASSYTLNMALNRAGIDYQGGGCRFLRYNCNVTDTRKGWMMMHPGRLTHFHEGLATTAGTRYILVSFVNP